MKKDMNGTEGKRCKCAHKFAVIAGPCAVESRSQLAAVAATVSECGLRFLRAGAWKPRTSLHSFQGLGSEGLTILREVADEFKLKVVTEVLDPAQVEAVCETADIVQLGTRNMTNFALLKALGPVAARSGKPVVLKRGMAARIDEWLQAAEYLTAAGALVVYCERGIRTFETATRFTLDLMAVPQIKQLVAAPVIVDVSHGTGRADLVPAAARAAVAIGADGIMVEVHPDPAQALSDGAQSLSPAHFVKLMDSLTPLVGALGKTFL